MSSNPLSVTLSKDYSRILLWTSKSTFISLPKDAKGMYIMNQVLMERALAETPDTIGTWKSPTQHQVQELLAALSLVDDSVVVKTVGKKNAPADLSLEDLEL